MGKWSQLKSKLPRYEPEPTYQGKVERVKESLKEKNLFELGATLADAKRKKKILEAQVYDVNLDVEAISQLINDGMNATGAERFTVSGVGTVSQRIECYAHVNDEAALLAWVKARKLGGLLRFPWQTLNAMVKDMIADGKKLPPGVEAFHKEKISIYGVNHEVEAE